MGVVVNPIQTVNVKVNSQNAPRVQSSTSFVGAADLTTSIQQALNTANSALLASQSAYNVANNLNSNVI